MRYQCQHVKSSGRGQWRHSGVDAEKILEFTLAAGWLEDAEKLVLLNPHSFISLIIPTIGLFRISFLGQLVIVWKANLQPWGPVRATQQVGHNGDQGGPVDGRGCS